MLVAEDNAVNRLLVKRMFEKLGCRIDLASNGREAVEMARQLHYDVIFMDCFMPELDGYSASREIRALEQGDQPCRSSRSRRMPWPTIAPSALLPEWTISSASP